MESDGKKPDSRKHWMLHEVRIYYGSGVLQWTHPLDTAAGGVGGG